MTRRTDYTNLTGKNVVSLYKTVCFLNHKNKHKTFVLSSFCAIFATEIDNNSTDDGYGKKIIPNRNTDL